MVDARVRIRGAIFDELRRLDWVPRSVHEKARKIERVMQELTQQSGQAPSDAEMAKALKISIVDYEELLERAEDAEDVAWLKRARQKPLHYRPLEDYLAGRRRN